MCALCLSVCIFHTCRVLPIMSDAVLNIKLALHPLWLSNSHSFFSWNEYGAKVSEFFIYTEAFTRVTQGRVLCSDSSLARWESYSCFSFLCANFYILHASTSKCDAEWSGSRISLKTGITKRCEKARRVFTAGQYLSEVMLVTRTVI